MYLYKITFEPNYNPLVYLMYGENYKEALDYIYTIRTLDKLDSDYRFLLADYEKATKEKGLIKVELLNGKKASVKYYIPNCYTTRLDESDEAINIVNKHREKLIKNFIPSVIKYELEKLKTDTSYYESEVYGRHTSARLHHMFETPCIIPEYKQQISNLLANFDNSLVNLSKSIDSKNLTKNEVLSMFRKVYPEKEIKVSICCLVKDKGIVEAKFPDGTFYFAVNKFCVSSACKTLEEAKKYN